MARTVWVKAAHPRAQFYQEVDDPDVPGGVRIEHVRAETNGEGLQVPVPVEVTLTAAVNQALQHKFPGTQIPNTLVECTEEEVAEATSGKGESDEEAESRSSRRSRGRAKADKSSSGDGDGSGDGSGDGDQA